MEILLTHLLSKCIYRAVIQLTPDNSGAPNDGFLLNALKTLAYPEYFQIS